MWCRYKFEHLQDLGSDHYDFDGASLFIYNWLIGWAAAALASTIAMPFDTVKRVLMTDTYGSTKRYRSMLHCWVSLVEEDGFMRLWRGIYKLYRAGLQMPASKNIEG